MMTKEQILKHIQAARLWLDKAQDVVEKNNIIRGLSFLFLASAETQMPIRESQKTAKKNEPVKSTLRFKPVYGAALAASLAFIVSFAGWKIIMKSNQQVTAQRISASEFVSRMKHSNERESTKASFMLDETLKALKSQLEESKPAKKPSRWVAFHSPKKFKNARKYPVTKRASAENKKTYNVDTTVKEAVEDSSVTETAEKSISPSSPAEDDLFNLVKIAEKTLKGQN